MLNLNAKEELGECVVAVSRRVIKKDLNGKVENEERSDIVSSEPQECLREEGSG